MGSRDDHRLEALDGLRGVAALAVVIWHVHLHALLGTRPFATHAYLAVDLFFMISGFILGRAYGGRLAAGGRFDWFVGARLRRLAPLYVFGLLLGLAGFLVAKRSEAAGIGAGGVAVLLTLALACLPWAFGGPGGLNAFPLNPPSWSLSLEVWGNLLYAAVAPRLSHRVLALGTGGSAVVLVAVAVAGDGVNFGWRQGDVWVGALRFVFAFSAGLGLQRLAAAGRLALRRLPDWAPALALACVLTLPAAGSWNSLYDLVALFIVFPALIVVAVRARSSTPLSGALGVGARLSYPLYAVHAGVVALVGAAAAALHASEPQRPLVAAAALVLSVAVAWIAERFFDRPVRAWLARWPRRAVAIAHAPAI